MDTQETEREAPGLGSSAKNVAEHASALARLELELAQLEIKRKLGSLAMGIGLGAGAALFLLFALGFGIGAAAAGIATQMSTWAALLIVTGALLLITLVLGLIAAWAIKRGTPPVPEQALREAKLTSEALRHDGRS